MVERLRANRSVVTPLHLEVMALLVETERSYGGDLGLRLEGGTALAAYYLGHRESADLDFFGGPGFDARDFRERFTDCIRKAGIDVPHLGPANPGFAELFVSRGNASGGAPLKVQFCRSSPFQLEPPLPTEEGIRVASFRDVCAGKFHAVCDRFEPRDFIDLHAILTRPEGGTPVDASRIRARFRSLVADLIASDPGLTPALIGPSLQRGRDCDLVKAFPLRLLVPASDAEIQTTLRHCCEELSLMVAGEWQH